MPAELRPYQADAIARVKAEFVNIAARVMLVMPTGSGKTVVAAQLVIDMVATGKKVLILTHRRELMEQMAGKLAGVYFGRIAAGHPTDPLAPVQIATISTLHARAIRTATIDLPAADLVVVDEAHHTPAKTWTRIIDQFSDAHVLGLSATPTRADGRGLGGTFKTMVLCPSTAELIKAGYLVPAQVYAPDKPDLSKIGVARGDYKQDQLAAVMDQPTLVGDVVTQYHRYGQGRKAIVFATGRQHAVHIRNSFGESDIAAAVVDGETPIEERDEILRRFAAGTIQVMVNCAVFTEGFDCPDAGCIIFARPTKSLSLYLQMAGRGLRTAPGKTDCIIIDHAGCTEMHGFVDEEIEWTLAPDKKPRQPKKEARSKRRATTLVECPECSAVRWQGSHCSACGWRPRTRSEALEVVDADLVQVERGASATKPAVPPDAKVDYYRMLLWIARERGFSPGWAWHKVNEKFGHQVRTPRGCSPLPPTPEVRAWVKSRTIAWMKQKAKAQAEGRAA